MKSLLALACAVGALALSTGCASLHPDPLPSWNDGPAKASITSFVERTTNKGGPAYVAPEARIAVFDNDGTLWVEQPMYTQLAFAIDRIHALAPHHPEWATQEPYASILKGDLHAALAGGDTAVLELVAATHAGMTTDEFEATVAEWIASARHPTLDQPYTQCIYAPMVEVLDYLRDNGFQTYIVSGGGVEFMRPWTEPAYGVPPENVVGSSGKTRYEIRTGEPVLVKLPEIQSIDDKAGKPENINLHIGRRPIIAFGNSDGDQQMLEWTAPNGGLCVLIHHTDDVREFAYDKDSSVGHLDTALAEAHERGWTVVSMKTDWTRIFAWQQTSSAP